MNIKKLIIKLIPSIFMMSVLWLLGICLSVLYNNMFYIINFSFIGTALGLGLSLYTLLPRNKKEYGRMLSQLLIGTYMFVFLGILKCENMQIEGFFFYLLAGYFFGVVIHYFVAKIFGPLLFNRGFCGWGCWTAMVLDLLPFKRSPGRNVKLEKFRYVSFGLSLSLVLFLWFVVGYRVEPGSITEIYWFLAGNAIYYAIGITLAFLLKDNRAFCKYVCPISVMLKASARFSRIRIRGYPDKCISCRACEKVCPMDIPIVSFISRGEPVLSTECILCTRCINVCPRNALYLSF